MDHAVNSSTPNRSGLSSADDDSRARILYREKKRNAKNVILCELLV